MRAIRTTAPLASILGLCIASFLANACGGSQQSAPTAPPPPPVTVPPPAPPPAASASTAPAPVAAAEAAPAPAKKSPGRLMHHPALAMLFAEIEQVGLRPEQQTAVNNIQADLEKQTDTLNEPHAQLTSDLADGAAAGKLDKAKIEADSKKLAQAAESMTKSAQDAANRLHETLDAPQRKKLVDLVREKAERMQAHAMGPMHGPAAGGHGMGMGPKNGAPGPGKELKGGAAPGERTQPAPATGSPQAAGAGPKDGHDHMMGMGHPGPGPDGMGHPDMHMGVDRLSDLLGLTQDQREKLRTKFDALMKSNMGAMKNMHATMQKRMKAIADAFASDKFDAKKVGIGEKHGELMRTMVKARVEFVEMVLSVLTPEQRVKFADHIRQHCEVCEEGN